MQIAVTKNLADAMGIKPPAQQGDVNPLFSWTANWTNVWEDEDKDMLVLVNNATRFTVAVYQVQRRDLRHAAEIIQNAIKHTLLAMNVNPELVEEYMVLAGSVEFVQNKNRTRTAWVSRAGLECALHVGRVYQGVEKMFSDRVGVRANYRFVKIDQKDDVRPFQVMFDALMELTGKPLYRYRAFELLVTLDLEIYKAVRRLIVPADLEFIQLHRVLQEVFNWDNHHLYEFSLFDDRSGELITMLVPTEEFMDLHPKAVLQADHTLSDFLPEHKSLLYTYDMGDNWEHQIELVRVIEDYDQESPYLLEASGQTPPEDVGGIPGFIHFYTIMLDPQDPEHDELKDWAFLWSLELNEWQKKPRAIRV